jgi:hypothetical protein
MKNILTNQFSVQVQMIKSLQRQGDRGVSRRNIAIQKKFKGLRVAALNYGVKIAPVPLPTPGTFPCARRASTAGSIFDPRFTN